VKITPTFVNKFHGRVRIFWVGEDGLETGYGVIEVGQSYSPAFSFNRHVWRFYTDTPEKELVYETELLSGKTRYVIPDCGEAPENTPRKLLPAHLNIKTLPAPTTSEYELRRLFPRCRWDKHIAEGDYTPPGFYIVCAAVKDSVPKIGFLRGRNDPVIVLDVPTGMVNSWHAIRGAVTDTLGLPLDRLGGEDEDLTAVARPYVKNRWQIFTDQGKYRIFSLEYLLAVSPEHENKENPSGTSFLFEGGVFFWPGVKIGHITEVYGVSGYEGSIVKMKTISLRPLVFEIKKFIRDSECEALKKLAAPFMKASSVSHMDKDVGKKDTQWRTSQTHFVERGGSVSLKDLERRVRDLTNIPISYGENAQVLRYEKGGHYYAHLDAFDPSLYQKSKHVLALTENGMKNRLSTVFWYMSDVAKGGATNFPRFNGAVESDDHSCKTGLSSYPEKGKIIIFHNMLPNGERDPLSLHGGCDVESDDIKWSANKWLWNKPKTTMGWAGDKEDLQREKSRDLLPKHKTGESTQTNFYEIGEGASTPLISDVPFGFVIPFLLMLGVACYLKGFNRQSNKERKKAQ
jgi:prolyl 4-hydroxylase